MWVAYALNDKGDQIVPGNLAEHSDTWGPAVFFKRCVEQITMILNGNSELIQIAAVTDSAENALMFEQLGETLHGRSEPAIAQRVFNHLQRIHQTIPPAAWKQAPATPAAIFLHLFLTTTNQNSYFKRSLQEKNHPNQAAFITLTETVKQIRENNLTITPDILFDLLSDFKIEGVKQIILLNLNHLKNENNLFLLQFPPDLIPNQYLCSISYNIMTNPCHEPNVADMVEKDIFLKILSDRAHPNRSPFTRAELRPDQLISNNKLADEIALFIEKVRALYLSFKLGETPSALRKTAYKAHLNLLIDSSLSTEKFASTLKKHSQHILPLNTLLCLYKIKHTIQFLTDPALPSVMEQLLRRICFAGNPEHLNHLLTRCAQLNIQLNLNAISPESKRTALHFLVIGASKASSAPASSSATLPSEGYLAYYEILLDQGAADSLDIQDDHEGKNRTPLEYDTHHLFPALSSAHRPS